MMDNQEFQGGAGDRAGKTLGVGVPGAERGGPAWGPQSARDGGCLQTEALLEETSLGEATSGVGREVLPLPVQ